LGEFGRECFGNLVVALFAHLSGLTIDFAGWSYCKLERDRIV
jgi:hypothetical protein